jgi:hypothetical protein
MSAFPASAPTANSLHDRRNELRMELSMLSSVLGTLSSWTEALERDRIELVATWTVLTGTLSFTGSAFQGTSQFYRFTITGNRSTEFAKGNHVRARLGTSTLVYGTVYQVQFFDVPPTPYTQVDVLMDTGQLLNSTLAEVAWAPAHQTYRDDTQFDTAWNTTAGNMLSAVRNETSLATASLVYRIRTGVSGLPATIRGLGHTHYITTNATTWTVTHNLGYDPAVRVYTLDATLTVLTEVTPTSVTYPSTGVSVSVLLPTSAQGVLKFETRS